MSGGVLKPRQQAESRQKLPLRAVGKALAANRGPHWHTRGGPAVPRPDLFSRYPNLQVLYHYLCRGRHPPLALPAHLPRRLGAGLLMIALEH